MMVVRALRDKRAELAGVVNSLERKLTEQRAALTHVDATMRLFDPAVRPEQIRPRRPRARSSWFRAGECLRLIYDVLRDAPQPVTPREVAEQIAATKKLVFEEERGRMLLHKVVLGSLSRAKDTIERIEAAGVVSWQIRQVGRG